MNAALTRRPFPGTFSTGRLGFDHEKLTFRLSGIGRRLTDVHGQVIREVLA